MTPTRIIHQDDALVWLKNQGVLTGCSLITSMPDISEFPQFTLEQWKTWFIDAASLVLSSCPDDGVTIFYQTDIKYEGAWVDKSYLCQKAAEKMGHELIAHKIICRAPPGSVTFGRPGYSHLICFSKQIRPLIKKALVDVMPKAGESSWTRGMGLEACKLACRFVTFHTASHTIVDPFCGHGAVLAVANEMGLNAIGVELSRKRAKAARSFVLAKSELT
jgi:hypothetical protein